MNEILIFPSDERQKYMKEYLQRLGYSCKFFENIEDIENASDIVLPIPSTECGKIKSSSVSISDFAKAVNKKCTVYGFLISDSVFAKMLEERRINYFDCYLCEQLKISNAYLTAQGILQNILNDTKKSLKNNKILISGYGKTGSAICDIFYRNMADVTVLVRREEYKSLLEEKKIKCLLYQEIKNKKSNFDYLINTVDTTVIDYSVLQNLNSSCKLLEIASKPYGIDFDTAKKFGFKYEILPSLPSKSTPSSAGEILAKTVDKYLKEEKLWNVSKWDLQ